MSVMQKWRCCGDKCIRAISGLSVSWLVVEFFFPETYITKLTGFYLLVQELDPTFSGTREYKLLAVRHFILSFWWYLGWILIYWLPHYAASISFLWILFARWLALIQLGICCDFLKAQVSNSTNLDFKMKSEI